MPAFSPEHQMFMVSENDGRFSWLTHPLSSRIWIWLIVTGILYTVSMMLGWFFLPLAAMLWLLPGLADLTVNLLSLKEMMRSPYSYHSAPLVMVFAIASAQGAVVMMRRRKAIKCHDLMIACAIMTMALHYVFAALPYRVDNFWGFTTPQLLPADGDAQAMHDIRAMVPISDVVAAQDNIIAHFGNWPEIYRFPNVTDRASWLLLRLSMPLSLPCTKYIETLSTVLRDPGWSVAYWKSSWLVLHRGGKDAINNRETVISAVTAMRSSCRSKESTSD